MLARIAHELYWIGRQLARAEHTSRMLDGVFHADLQGRPDDPAGVRLCWDALLTIVSGEPPETSASRDEVLRLLTLDPEHPTSVLNCITARPRGRPDRPRRLLRRDVGGDQHLPPRPAAAQHLRRRADRPVQRLRVRARALRAVLGRDRAHDAARRGPRLPAGRAPRSSPPTWSCGCCASRCPPTPRAARRTCATARRSRCCRPSAASRPTGARSRRRPTRGPVARFLLFERDYPDSVAFSIEALHNALTAADPTYRSSPAVLRLSRLMADLDFRARTADAGRQPRGARSSVVQTELRPGRFRHRRPVLWQPGAARRASRSPYELRHPLPDRVPLQRPGHGQPERAARQARDARHPERRGLRRARGPGVAPEPAPGLLRHDRDRVRDLAPARAPVDRRPRPRADHVARRSRRRPTGARSRTAPTTPPRASSSCSTAPSPTTSRSTTSSA